MGVEFLQQIGIIVSGQIELVDKWQHRLHISKPSATYVGDTYQHFHTVPELFIQVSGVSDMRTTNDKMSCPAGEMMLMPKGVSHRELAAPSESEFRNIVVAFGRETISVHASERGKNNSSQIAELEQCASYDVVSLCGYLDSVIAWQQSGAPHAAGVIRGLLLAFFNLLLNNIESPSMEQRDESYKILHCRRIVSEHLTNPLLNVEWLAGIIECSPDYLSHLFHIETGCRLTVYINDKRIAFAHELLMTSSFNIAEVAQACGYHDAGYMARQFKKCYGESPRKYRNGMKPR